MSIFDNACLKGYCVIWILHNRRELQMAKRHVVEPRLKDEIVRRSMQDVPQNVIANQMGYRRDFVCRTIATATAFAHTLKCDPAEYYTKLAKSKKPARRFRQSKLGPYKK